MLDRERALAQAQALRARGEAGHIRGPLHGIPVADQGCAGRRRPSDPRRQQDPRTDCAEHDRCARRDTAARSRARSFSARRTPPSSPISTVRRRPAIRTTSLTRRADPARARRRVVAAGMVPLSLGTQTAGSVSRPAAYCGIAAFKPSTLAWSSFGLVPFSPSFDTVGVFGYRVRDAVGAARVLMPAYLRRGAAAAPAPLSIGVIDDPILRRPVRQSPIRCAWLPTNWQRRASESSGSNPRYRSPRSPAGTKR